MKIIQKMRSAPVAMVAELGLAMAAAQRAGADILPENTIEGVLADRVPLG